MPPEATIELLNTYYTLMFEAVSSQDGIVSLMVGDGLMAIFGAPKAIDNPSQSAVAAAQDMLSMTAVLNEERAASGEPKLKIGFGIALVAIEVGQLVKVAGVDLLLDEQTSKNLADPSACTPIPSVELKGFSKSLNVYAL